MTSHEVNTRIDQPIEHDIHRGRIDQPMGHDIHRGLSEYHVSWFEQSLYSPKLKVINCFII